MKRATITSLALLAVWGGIGPNFAAAQFGTLGQAPPRVRPAISPFINMGAGGANAYYGIIRPQMDANRSINALQQGLNQLNPDGSLKGQIDAQSGATNALGGLQTGHAASFFNYGHYYPLTPGGTNIAGAGAALGGGLGGLNTGLRGGGFGLGLNAGRTFFSGNLAQPLVR